MPDRLRCNNDSEEGEEKHGYMAWLGWQDIRR